MGKEYGDSNHTSFRTDKRRTDSREDELLEETQPGTRDKRDRDEEHAEYKYDSVTIVYGPPILSPIPRATLNLSVALYSLRDLVPLPHLPFLSLR